MQKLLLASLTLISAQTLAMPPGIISARASSVAARLAGAKRTRSISTYGVQHLKYVHAHDAFLAQQLKNVAPLSAAEVATRAALLSRAIKEVGFLTWEEYGGAEEAHVRHTVLAEKSAMLDRKELWPVIHACKNAIVIERSLLDMPLYGAHNFAIYPFRFGAGLKYYLETNSAVRSRDLR